MKKLEWVNQKVNLRLTFADAEIKVNIEEKFKRYFSVSPFPTESKKSK